MYFEFKRLGKVGHFWKTITHTNQVSSNSLGDGSGSGMDVGERVVTRDTGDWSCKYLKNGFRVLVREIGDAKSQDE